MFLPGEVLDKCYGNEFLNNNLCSDVKLKSKKSVDVIVAEGS